MTIQLDLFLENDEESLAWRKISEIEQMQMKCNRAQFARLSEIEKHYIKRCESYENELGEMRKILDKLLKKVME